jgi:hypothetical protein
MAQTPLLAIDQIAEGQSSAYLVANAGISALEEAENKQLAVDMSGGDVTLTQNQFLRNVLFRCSGQVDDDNLTIPSSITVDASPATPQRKFLVRNDSDTYTVTVTDGTVSYVVPTEATALLVYDGTNLDGVVAADSSGTFLGLSDTPSVYTGKAGQPLRVKSDESGVEFVSIKVQDMGVDVTDSEEYTTLNFNDVVFGTSASGGVVDITFDPAQISLTDLAEMPSAPGASEDGKALVWDDSAGEYVFDDVGGGGGGGGPYSLTENAQTGTTYTPVLTDADDKYISLSNAGSITVTIPPNATTAFDVGDVINLLQKGAGQVTIAAGAGVTINYPDDTNPKTRGQNSWVTLVKQATDTWYALGDLEQTGSGGGGGSGGTFFSPKSGTSLSDFPTQVTNGTAAGSASDDDSRGLCLSVTSGGTDDWLMRLKSASAPVSGTDTYIARCIVDFEADGVGSEYPAGGIVLRNSTNGRALFFGVERPSTQDQNVSATTWTNDTYGAAVGTADIMKIQDIWLRVDVADDGTITLLRSRTGVGWISIGSTNLSTFLEAATGSWDQIGFGVKYHSGAVHMTVPFFSDDGSVN